MIDPLPAPLAEPEHQAQVRITDDAIIAIGLFPAGSPHPDTIEIVDLTDEQWTAIQTAPPGQMYLEEDGSIRVEPPPPPPIQYSYHTTVNAQVRTNDDQPLEVFRFPCDSRHLYRASLTISGIDAAPVMTSLVQEGRFVWKRVTSNAILVGITVVSQIPTTIPTGWATNCFPDGSDIVFTVKGPSGRYIDWLLVGEVGTFAPEGVA